MTDRPVEPMTAYEERLGRELLMASDRALRPIDASAIALSVVAGDARQSRWAGLVSAFRPSRLLVVLLLALAAVGGAILIGSLLPDPSPLRPFRLGHLAYALDGDIWVADWDGANAVRIADGDTAGSGFESPRWSQDGSTLSFVGYDVSVPDTLIFYLADRDGRRVLEVGRYAAGGSYWVPVVSPDGAQFLVDRGDDFMTIVDRDGGSTHLPVPAGFAIWNAYDPPSWTPDGSRIIVRACTRLDCRGDRPDGRAALFSVPVSGAPPTRLTPEDADDWGAASTSPDGSMLTLIGPDGRLWVMQVDGTDRRLFDPQANPAPVNNGLVLPWSSEGRRIAGTGKLDGYGNPTGGIWIVSLDTEEPARLLPGTGRMHWTLKWSPDGRSLLVAGRSDLEGAVDDPGALWSVEVDGDSQRIVSGTRDGDWQWLPVDASTSFARP